MENMKIDSKDVQRGVITAALLVGVCLIGATWIGTAAWKTVRGYDNALSVTGSTKERVTSDQVKWTMEVTRHSLGAEGLKDANKAIKADLISINTWLTGLGIDAKSITVTPVYTMENYDYNKSSSAPRDYTLRSTVTVASSDVEKLTQLAKNTDTLVNQGVFVNTVSLEYYFSKLADLRVSLLGAAIKDARARAEEIAKADGKSVGVLKSASSGVVQVLPVNSVDVSDYGSYDTQNIEKEVSVTVRASFVLN
jgi:hypothetical protein